ncbi:MAG: replication-relaxation family protein [Chloroflexi bacterium]|nr:replication-relaxation family protein [Chloroflexota bacterium]
MSEKKRLRRDRRSDTPPKMRLTERDVDILKAVAEYRILRQDHIQQLFFGSKSTAQYRLSHLYQHGFLNRHFLPVYAGWSPTLYTLDKRGVALLKAACGIDRVNLWDAENGHEFLSHTLAINNFRVAVTVACRQAGYTLAQWIGEASLKADYDRVTITAPNGKKQSVSLIPDSYFTIETPKGRASFFLEMDMGTMTLGRFQNKIRAYLAYLESKAYQQRYQTRSLRVLTVTTSAARSANLKAATEHIHRERLFWFTHQALVTVDQVLHAPIWQLVGQEVQLPLIPR